MSRPLPPRLAAWLAGRRLPPDVREFALGDLEEEFLDRIAGQGARAARRWYWRQAVRALLTRPPTPVWRAPASPRSPLMSHIAQDFRFALRLMRRSPGFTLVVTVTLALGIGATTTIFSVVNRLLLNPLPYKDGQRLVFLWRSNPQFGPLQLSPTNEWVDHWRRDASSFERIEGFTNRQYTLTGGEEPEEINAGLASVDLFSFLGVEPRLGRAFTTDDALADVAMLSYGLWQRRFGGDPDVIGRAIALDDRSFTVIGVVPRGFRLLWFGEEHLWLPLPPASGPRALNAVARLKPDVTVAQAEAELRALAAGFTRDNPRQAGWFGTVRAPRDMLAPAVRDALPILAGAVGLVLLIACANVANLMLARRTVRTRELTVRLAVGASRWRVARQLLVESLVLALAGGAVGIALAAWGIDLIVLLRPDTVPQLDDLTLDRGVLTFAVLVSIATSLLFGVLPAWQATRTDLNATLAHGPRAGAGGRGHRLVRSALVVAEVALSLVLLTGAGLLIRSFVQLQHTDPGFRPAQVLALHVDLPSSRYRTEAELTSFQERWRSRVAGIPGVQDVDVASGMPLRMGLYTGRFEVEGRTLSDNERPTSAGGTMVGPDYFRTLGIPVLKGRAFTAQDSARAPRVMIVNEEMARRLWPDADAVGQRLRWNPKEEFATIVGVVGNVAGSSVVNDSFKMQIYYPNAQMPSDSLYAVMRLDGDRDRGAVMAALRRELADLDARLPIQEIVTADDAIWQSLSRERFSAVLMLVFAGLALVLAAVGLYGLLSHLVSFRTSEIGTRMALGARSADVLRLVIGHGLTLTCIGIAIGTAAALAATRLISSLLVGVHPRDPLTFLLVAVVLTLVALVACYLPARRAARMNPLAALRHD